LILHDFLLRPAESSDIQRLFEWRNDPFIVSVSTSRREVSWDDHVAWFSAVVDRSRHLLFIVSPEPSVAIGSVRLDRKGEDWALISISLIASHRGRGLGPRAIDEACQNAFDHWPTLSRVWAYVRADNHASIAAFTRARFAPAAGEEPVPGGHLALVRMRNSS